MPSLLHILNALYKQHLRGNMVDIGIFLVIRRNGFATHKQICSRLPAIADNTIHKHIQQARSQGLLFSVSRATNLANRAVYYCLTEAGQKKLIRFILDLSSELDNDNEE